MNKLGLVVAAGSILSLGAYADDGVILGGYADAGYTAQMVDKMGGIKIPDQNGFLVREGAVYLGKKWGTEWEVFGDFAYSHNAVHNGFTGATAAGAGSLYVSQAFISQNMDNGFWWKLGQFDGIYGYYAGRSDSHAHRLTDMGYIQGAYLPSYHLGVEGGYSFSDLLKVTLLVANDNEDFGPNGAAGPSFNDSGTRRADFGFLVSADFDAISADVGAYFMTGEDTGPTATAPGSSKLGYVVSAVVQGTFNPLTAGLYGVAYKNDQGNNDATGVKNSTDFGVGANVGYDVNNKLGLNLRFEYVNTKDKTSIYNPVLNTWLDLTAGGTSTITKVNSVVDATIGGQWKFNDNVKAKLDYSYIKASTSGGSVDPFHVVNAGIVANF